ncbi:EAL domain-containing protein [Leptospira interrogans]
MTADSQSHRRQARSRPLREAFILTAMVIVTLAVGAALIVQFDWPFWMSALAALALYVGLVSVHALLRRTETIRELSDEIGRLEDEVSLIRQRNAEGSHPQSRAAMTAPLQSSADPKRIIPAELNSPATADTPNPRPANATAASPSPGASIKAAAAATAPQATAPVAKSEPARPAAQVTAPAGKAPVTKDVPATEGVAPKAGASMNRFWAFRPNDPHTPASEPAAQPTSRRASETVRTDGPARATSADAANTPSISEGGNGTPAVAGDVGVIGGMIRKYAEEIGPPNPNRSASGSAAPSGPQKPNTTPAQQDIDQSVDALRATANEMRRSAGSESASPIERGVLPPLRPETIKGPLPPPVNHSHVRMAAIADGIATDKFDVYLEPIVALADRKVRHYEIALRLRTEPTGSMGADEYVPIARGTGMLPFIDTTLMTRAATMARHMDERGSGGSLFVELTAESLTNQGFQWEFAEACRHTARLSERLILTFDQSDIREFTAPHWDAVRQLTAAGFKLAIDDVVSFDPDLADLKEAGFRFLRFTARTMINGMPSLEGPVTGTQLCQRLAVIGLAPMVKAIETDEQFARMMDAGISLGQGALFGPRLPVKAQVLQPSRNVVAA